MSKGDKIFLAVFGGVMLIGGIALSIYMMIIGLQFPELPLRVVILWVVLGVIFLVAFIFAGTKWIKSFRKVCRKKTEK